MLTFKSRHGLLFSIPAGTKRGRSDRALYLVAGAGWAVMVTHAAGLATGGHSHATTTSAASAATAVVVGAGSWMAMIAATMLPLIGANVRFVALRSPRQHRRPAAADVVAGWAFVWAGTVAAIAAISWLLVGAAGRVGATTGAFAVAAAWQRTHTKRRSVARCHRTLAPSLDRARARVEGRRFGVRLGADCATSCWALMLPMAVLDHHLLVVVPLAGVAWFERRQRHTELLLGRTSLVVAATGAVAVAAVAVG